jgi:hypothetical protein
MEGMAAWESRAHRREQIEFLAHRRHHPGGIAARIGGMPDRTHHPSVELAQTLFGDTRKGVAMLRVPVLADWQRPPFDLQALACCSGFHHLDAFRNDFEPDVVAEQDADLQAHSRKSVFFWVVCPIA